MKKALYLILAALLMNACTMAEIAPPDVLPEEDGEHTYIPAPTLFAQVEDSETKTVLDGLNVSFEEGDRISVNGTSYTATSHTPTRFYAAAGSVLDVSSDSLHAYYPEMLWNGGKPALPASYDCKFKADGTPKFNMPLSAREKYLAQTTITLNFFHFTAFIGITVKNSGDDKNRFSEVSSIAISTDKQIHGKFKLDYKDKSFAFVDDPEQTISSYVTLNMAEGSRGITAEGKTFYLPLPVGSYNRLLVRVAGKNDSSDKTAYMITAEGKPGAVARNTRYLLDFTNNFTGYGIPVMGEGKYTEETEAEDKDYRY